MQMSHHGATQAWWLCLHLLEQRTSSRLHRSSQTLCQARPVLAFPGPALLEAQYLPLLQTTGHPKGYHLHPVLHIRPALTMWQPLACAGLLGSNISTATPLMEAGLDSIGAVEMRNAVNEKYGVELPATIMFDYPTIGDLAHYMVLRTASSTMHASAGGLDQMRAYVPDASAVPEIAKVNPQCFHHTQTRNVPVGTAGCKAKTGTLYRAGIRLLHVMMRTSRD